MKLFHILALTAAVSGTQLTPGDKCPTDIVKKHFDLKRYLGTWFEYRESFGQIFKDNQECIKANYSMRDDGLVKVLNSGQKHDPVEEGKFLPRTFLEGKARLTSDPSAAKLEVSFFGDNWAPYDIIDTDYETYALVYGCEIHEGEGKFENAWVLTRELIDTEEKRLDETEFTDKFQKYVPGFNYTYVFGDRYATQGTVNGCDQDGPEVQKEETMFLY